MAKTGTARRVPDTTDMLIRNVSWPSYETFRRSAAARELNHGDYLERLVKLHQSILGGADGRRALADLGLGRVET